MRVVLLSSGSLSFSDASRSCVARLQVPAAATWVLYHHSLDSESSLGLTPREARSARFVSSLFHLQIETYF